MISDAQIFTPTCINDLKWLECALFSIKKYWTSKYPPIILANEDCQGKMPPIVQELRCDVRYVRLWSDGRRDQVYLKMLADQDVDVTAEVILYMDSDCLFTMPTTTQDFCDEQDRPFVRMMPYETLLAKNLSSTVRWSYEGYRTAVNNVLGHRPDFEYMQMQPFLYFKDTVYKTRLHIEGRMQKSLKEVMTRYHSAHFSEFNFFGAFASFHQPQHYHFLLPEEWGTARMRWFHSWTQSPDSERAEINRILAGG